MKGRKRPKQPKKGIQGGKNSEIRPKTRFLAGFGLTFDWRMETQGKEYKRLKTEDVRKVAGFENKTEEELQAIILSLEKLSLIVLQKFAVQKAPS